LPAYQRSMGWGPVHKNVSTVGPLGSAICQKARLSELVETIRRPAVARPA
jgi:hypothetical protein